MPKVLDGKAIFIHIPKNAGTSLEFAFGLGKPMDYSEAERKSLLFGRFEQHKAVQHYTPEQLVATGLLDLDSYRKMFSFAFVRNPFDRFVSEYKYRLKKQPGFASFDDFAEQVYIKWQEDALYGYLWNHLVPQVDYIYGRKGLGVDFVGRFEHLENDLKLLCQRLEIENIALEKHNQSVKSKSYQEYFSPRSKALISEVYAVDLAEFSYNY